LVRNKLVPHVVRLVDHHVQLKDLDASAILFALRVLSLYGSKSAVERIADLSRQEWVAGEFLWSILLEVYARKDHPHRSELVESLRDPLPRGFAAVAYLDLTNTMAREGALLSHPFDTQAGHSLMRAWLSAQSEDEDSYAISAVAAVPFLSSPAREQLLDLAKKHRSAEVRLEASWANARIGRRRGVNELAKAALDPALSPRAIAYLEELGMVHEVPKAAFEPTFRAKAEMISWLRHPMEFGRLPDQIELYDSRELVWPPTNDKRRVYLFRYEYEPRSADDERDVGIGMVGSVTFALFGESTGDKSPAEVYALHCAWELQQNADARAPNKRTVSSGMRILRKANPGVADFTER
jgi:hypothetical protein